MPTNRPQAVSDRKLGGISLGDSYETVINAYPPRKQYDELHDAATFRTDNEVIDCSKSYHRNALSTDESEFFFYFDESDHVLQIEARGADLQLNGVKIGEPSPTLTTERSLFRLLESGSPNVGGADLQYVVNQKEGIAYEIQTAKSSGRSHVSKLILFPEGTKFQPATCVTPPQKLIEELR